MSILDLWLARRFFRFVLRGGGWGLAENVHWREKCDSLIAEMKVKLSNPPTGAVKVRLLSSWFTFCLFSFFLFVDSSDDMLIGMMKQWDSLDEETKLAFTLSGNASVEELFVDDSNKGSGTHYKYSESDIEEFVNQAAKMIETVRKLPEEVR